MCPLSSAVSYGSRAISKKSALLRNLILSGMKWSLNKEYIFMLILFEALYFTVYFISVTPAPPNAQMNIPFIFTSISSLNWGRISLSVVIIFKSMSWVILTNWINLLHQSLAVCMVFFSKIGKAIF